MQLYVKKVWSLNPTQYEYLSIEKALIKYDDYIVAMLGQEAKSFKKWLKTEI